MNAPADSRRKVLGSVGGRDAVRGGRLQPYIQDTITRIDNVYHHLGPTPRPAEYVILINSPLREDRGNKFLPVPEGSGIALPEGRDQKNSP